MSNLVWLDTALALRGILVLEFTDASLFTGMEPEGTIFLGILGILLDLLLTLDSLLPGNGTFKVSLSDNDLGELDLALFMLEHVLSIGTDHCNICCGFIFEVTDSLQESSSPIIIPESPFSTSSRLP